MDSMKGAASSLRCDFRPHGLAISETRYKLKNGVEDYAVCDNTRVDWDSMENGPWFLTTAPTRCTENPDRWHLPTENREKERRVFYTDTLTALVALNLIHGPWATNINGVVFVYASNRYDTNSRPKLQINDEDLAQDEDYARV
jgi:hypothetical protein